MARLTALMLFAALAGCPKDPEPPPPPPVSHVMVAPPAVRNFRALQLAHPPTLAQAPAPLAQAPAAPDAGPNAVPAAAAAEDHPNSGGEGGSKHAEPGKTSW